MKSLESVIKQLTMADDVQFMFVWLNKRSIIKATGGKEYRYIIRFLFYKLQLFIETFLNQTELTTEQLIKSIQSLAKYIYNSI